MFPLFIWLTLSAASPAIRTWRMGKSVHRLYPSLNMHVIADYAKVHMVKGGIKDTDMIDWRIKGIVSDVQNQGTCGSCYLFAAIGSLEGMWGQNHDFVQLSKQNILDCDKSEGCRGGGPLSVFDFIKKQGGVESEDFCPYEGVDNKTCSYDPTKSVANDIGYTIIPENDEDALEDAVFYVGPVAACFHITEDLAYYESGVWIPDDDCTSSHYVHCLLIVGFGNEDDAEATPYWIIKNSWGVEWGEDGYFRMIRGINACGVASWAMYPTVP